MRNLLTAIFGLTLVAGAAFAASPTTPVFYQLDTDADGSLTRAELTRAPYSGVNLTRADMNKDGSLSESEYAAATGGGMQTDGVVKTY